jgi:3-hydroxybutyryl-CoA dehydrogenase
VIRQITVIGANPVGRGIAALALGAGYSVVFHDPDAGRLEEASRSVAAAAGDRAARESFDATPDLEPACRAADLIVEAFPENLDLKKEVLSQADVFCAPDTILASNTSILPIRSLAGAVERRDLFVGVHFFNPPEDMPLVEIAAGERTAPSTVETMREVVRRMGKEPIVVHDSPGLATSRLGMALALEAIRLLEGGTASAEDIDRAMELGYGHPVGPLRMTDLVGLDVRLAVAEHLAALLGERFAPPALLRELVSQGKLGRKSGEGFYRWPSAG